MNAAVRAVVRAGLSAGAELFAVGEGLQGLIEGRVRPLDWNSVAGILQQGGTVLGTARSQEFRHLEGRRRAALCLLQHGIDRLVVCGGDGSLTGASLLVEEWPVHVKALVEAAQVTEEQAGTHPQLFLVGLPGSIDNDLCGSDQTIGANTALQRIVAALDAIFSTAASHQRTFVIEVMGRNCGYLALSAGLAIGAEGVLIPEAPPEADWADQLSAKLRAGRSAGRRASMVIVAEGARERDGSPITCQGVCAALQERLGEDVRVTILGHVQRGGSPSAYDRNLSTLLGCLAGQMAARPDPEPPCLVGLVGNRPHATPLSEVLRKNEALSAALRAGRYEEAQLLRGNSFQKMYLAWKTLIQARPEGQTPTGRRLAILHAGGPAPGMNMAARAAVRLALDRGHTVFGVHNGFQGLVDGKVESLNWMSVTGWASLGGAELGTHRLVPSGPELYAVARTLEQNGIDCLLMIGGWAGYETAYRLHSERANFPAFDIPMLCLPASIDNNLPGSEVSIGADTALNCIVEAVDRIKRSAVSNNRCFIVEVMGAKCGYLALSSALATGAERVYLHETGISCHDLLHDVEFLTEGFRAGKKVGLVIRNERANELYSTHFVADLFEEEGGDVFDVRQATLGHLQQGGDPTPYDRTRAVRLALAAIDHLQSDEARSGYLGYQRGELFFTELHEFPRQVVMEHQRPRKQWWLKYLETAEMLARPVEVVGRAPLQRSTCSRGGEQT